MTSKIILCDINDRVVDSLDSYFKEYPVNIVKGSLFEQQTNVIATAGNSFGYMDGGIDLEICKFFGKMIEVYVQDMIRKKYDGLMPIGEAECVFTNDKRIPYLIYAPTMRLPQNIRGTDNVYNAMKGILKCVKSAFGKDDKIAIPGLGTGFGEMFPDEAAKQMKDAFLEEILQ